MSGWVHCEWVGLLRVGGSNICDVSIESFNIREHRVVSSRRRNVVECE